MLSSLFRNTPRATMRVFMLTQDLSEVSRSRSERVCAKHNHELVPLYADREELSGVPVCAHFSKANYLRLLVAKMLPSDLDRVLYLDSDLVVRADIQPFYEQDLGDNLVAAVAEASARGDAGRLGIASDVQYFNTGVLLLNLALWREEKIGERALQFAIENAEIIQWLDQDALNATVQARAKICPPIWNAAEWVFMGFTAEQLQVDPSELERARTDPYIAHYTGGRKPWGPSGSTHPFGAEYYRYLRRTPYFGRKHLTRRIRAKVCRVLSKVGLA